MPAITEIQALQNAVFNTGTAGLEVKQKIIPEIVLIQTFVINRFKMSPVALLPLPLPTVHGLQNSICCALPFGN